MVIADWVVEHMTRVDPVVQDHLHHKDVVEEDHWQQKLVACQHVADNHFEHLAVVHNHGLEDHRDNHPVVDIVAVVVADSQDNGNAVVVVVDMHLYIDLVVAVEVLVAVPAVEAPVD